ncbi:MAG: group III truncated hemoglobin [Sulfurimonas sp.]|nr:group III truncated hemoglobin [Sulfurimonas sp.]MDQ7059964.1 group III truncated hemoglobin [Sulfurimonas sp.]MDQ7061269.1 group III truncated hemoglobin [Sulfurimonas sp.]
MELKNTITRENLRLLMRSFYIRTLHDKELGPYFINELGNDINNEEWQAHIELLADFWLAELLGEKTYKGNIYGAHIKVPHINRASFVNWLELFSLSLDEVYTPDISNIFIEKARLLSKDFICHLNI